MAVSDYDYVIGLVLRSEGGYTNNPKDPGGPTMYGITLKDYSDFKGRKVSANEVRTMPKSDALAIYKLKYNRGISFEALRAGADYCLLDYGINSGLGRPPRVTGALLRRPQISKMTQDMIKAINDTDPNKLIDAVCDERLHFMKQIRGGASWAEFGNGWNTRVASVRAISHKLAAGQIVSVPVTAMPVGQSAKAQHAPDPKTVANIKKGTGAGAVAGGSGAAHSALLAIGCVVTVVVIGGVAYYVYQRKFKKLQDTVELPPGMVPIAA